MELIVVTLALVGLAWWQKIDFLHIIAGVVAVGFGVWWIDQNSGFIYIIEGVVAVVIGFYMMINSAVRMVKG